MDVHRVDIVDETVSELRKAFDGDSFRVRRLMVNPAISQNTNDLNLYKNWLITWPNGWRLLQSTTTHDMVYVRLG